MLPRFRTIRQRRARALKAQVSAVATSLALLLVVTYLSNYLVFQLPGQMGDVEFEHLVEVENQFSRLQATIVAEPSRATLPLTLDSPVTLGSLSVPPFGPPSLGTIGPEPSGVSVAGAYQLNTVTPTAPDWGAFTPCLAGGSGHCAGNGNVNYANLSGNGTALSVFITGGSNSLVYNINGNNDSLSVTWNGKDAGITAIVINGSDDSVTYSKGGSDTSVPTMSFYFFGERDKFSMSLAGSHSTKGGMNVGVSFIGALGLLCPYGNNSASDTIGALGAGGSNLNMNVTWWNAVGYTTAPHLTPYTGSTIGTETISWQNDTGFVACPYFTVNTNTHAFSVSGGIQAHLANRYLPEDYVGYEGGAVLLTSPGEQSVMVNGPDFTYNVTASGLNAQLTFFELSGSLLSESGISTASVDTRVLSETTTTFGAGINGVYLGTPYFVNMTTLYPSAWINYFDGQIDVPSGATCIIPHPPLPSGYTCMSPPPQVPMEVVAPLVAQSVTVTIVQLAVQIT
jgi:hypothetical protein